jgi:hypothetical protein
LPLVPCPLNFDVLWKGALPAFVWSDCGR